jgi:hypothetical protein
MADSPDNPPPLVDVCPYSIATLRRILTDVAPVSLKTVCEKGHLGYFEEYFATLQATTIVIERSYTDRHWLEDYAAFYVRCLDGKYSSRCTRLHFFSAAFSRDDLLGCAVGSSTTVSEHELRDTYLGYIVIKPLPETFIGRTCLRTYAQSLGHATRHYPVTRKYEAHLLGMTLEVESLAFQEQDSVAAACATSALWSALHGTGVLFHHPILSPIEITRHATATHPSISRDVPNRGLSVLQMADAVRRVGLSPEVVPANSAAGFRVMVRAYLSARIPIVLMGPLMDWSDPNRPRYYCDNPYSGHAITITGYRLEPSLNETLDVGGRQVGIVALNMPKVYVHDDQVGPFARMQFCRPPQHVIGAGGQPTVLPAEFVLQTMSQSPSHARGSI